MPSLYEHDPKRFLFSPFVYNQIAEANARGNQNKDISMEAILHLGIGFDCMAMIFILMLPLTGLIKTFLYYKNLDMIILNFSQPNNVISFMESNYFSLIGTIVL